MRVVRGGDQYGIAYFGSEELAVIGKREAVIFFGNVLTVPVTSRTNGDDLDVFEFGNFFQMILPNIAQADAIVITQGRYELSRELAPIVKQRYPNLSRYISVKDPEESKKYQALGMIAVEPISQPLVSTWPRPF